MNAPKPGGLEGNGLSKNWIVADSSNKSEGHRNLSSAELMQCTLWLRVSAPLGLEEVVEVVEEERQGS